MRLSAATTGAERCWWGRSCPFRHVTTAPPDIPVSEFDLRFRLPVPQVTATTPCFEFPRAS